MSTPSTPQRRRLRDVLSRREPAAPPPATLTSEVAPADPDPGQKPSSPAASLGSPTPIQLPPAVPLSPPKFLHEQVQDAYERGLAEGTQRRARLTTEMTNGSMSLSDLFADAHGDRELLEQQVRDIARAENWDEDPAELPGPTDVARSAGRIEATWYGIDDGLVEEAFLQASSASPLQQPVDVAPNHLAGPNPGMDNDVRPARLAPTEDAPGRTVSSARTKGKAFVAADAQGHHPAPRAGGPEMSF